MTKYYSIHAVWRNYKARWASRRGKYSWSGLREYTSKNEEVQECVKARDKIMFKNSRKSFQWRGGERRKKKEMVFSFTTTKNQA